MDKDGDLDLFVMNHSSINYEKDVHKWEEVLLNKPTRIREKSFSTLYRNNGNGTFDDITKESGLYRPGFGLGVAVSDFDENGFLDIYVANDYFIPDFMFFNQGNGTFIEDIEIFSNADARWIGVPVKFAPVWSAPYSLYLVRDRTSNCPRK